ncbi:hypothetical protein A8C56_17900 [Niabella ginsenosidivorans]|uniref:DoxX-like family protein n=1 Tax=Niabella ginsenosidivorans TaxID=1176587 RepID=A0A1A9I4K2_9BACT|nr:DoxX family protein [Niabella ginsenosidivorans]ANH82598.1 hypothetical protein A8C56_17900 [Niabella ginsenosidivorans]
MKTTKILYWTFTGLIVLMDGVIPALTSHTELAKQGISHLGYPDYFRVLLTVFKISGAIVLAVPFFKGRIKEWAYAGFTFNFISAAVSHTVVDGFNGQAVFPLVALVLLAASYYCYHQLRRAVPVRGHNTVHYSVG